MIVVLCLKNDNNNDCATLYIGVADTAGQHVASVATAMGMKILSTRSSSSRADLEALLRVSDVISVHCPLTEHTRGLLGQEELRLMKSGVILVNYSRGDVLDEEVSVSPSCSHILKPMHLSSRSLTSLKVFRTLYDCLGILWTSEQNLPQVMGGV